MSDLAVAQRDEAAEAIIAPALSPPQLPIPAPHFPVNERLNDLEKALVLTFPPVECPLRHSFTPGLYCREIFMPAGSIITSKIHLTEHQFIVSRGRVSVWIEGEGWVQIEAPYHGITRPGTRRVLVVHEDTIWTTCHPTNLTDVDEIEARIIQPHIGHLDGLALPLREAVGMLAGEGES